MLLLNILFLWMIFYLILKNITKREKVYLSIDHSADIGYKDFIKIYRICTKEPFSFLTIDTTKDNKFINNFDETL